MSFLLEGITAVTWQQAVMYVVGIILIWLAVKKEYEPSLLLPLGFGAILVNLPYSGVVDQMVQGKVPAAGIIEWLFKTGIEASEAMPILLFIGIGAMIDFGPLLSQPVLFLFGAAAQFGIFAAILIACLMGFDLRDAASIGIIGAATHLHPGIPGSGVRVHRPHCGGGLFLYGPGSHYPALCHTAGDHQEGAPHPYGV